MFNNKELKNLFFSDVGKRILSYVSLSDYSNLVQTHSGMYQFFKSDLSAIRLTKLAYYLAQNPNLRQVQTIIATDLNLLGHVFKEIKLKSRSILNVTPLQFAYGARHPEMCEVLKPFFSQWCGSKEAGRKEIEKQLKEKFNSISDEPPFNFNPIIGVILNEPFNRGIDTKTNKWLLNPATLAAITEFRAAFDATQPQIIEQGFHFRLETLQELFTLYSDIADEYGGDLRQCNLLEDAVLSKVLEYISENDAQRFSQGLRYLQMKKPEALKQSFITRDNYHFYETLKAPSFEVMLDSSYIDIIFGEVNRDWNDMLIHNRHLYVEDFMSEKNSKLAKFKESDEISSELNYSLK